MIPYLGKRLTRRPADDDFYIAGEVKNPLANSRTAEIPDNIRRFGKVRGEGGARIGVAIDPTHYAAPSLPKALCEPASSAEQVQHREHLAGSQPRIS